MVDVLKPDRRMLARHPYSIPHATSHLVSPVPLSWRLADTLIVIVLVALSFFGALKAAEQITSGLLVSMNTDDAWFEGDIIQYYRMISTLDGAAVPLARGRMEDLPVRANASERRRGEPFKCCTDCIPVIAYVCTSTRRGRA